MNDTLAISEIFGSTFQGEGRNLGKRAGFVRLGGCNLACTWCDTPYTWDWGRFNPDDEVRSIPITDVYAQVLDMDVPLVVITGGEPLLQQKQLRLLCELLISAGKTVEIETNGTVVPSHLADLPLMYDCSPKLKNSGNAKVSFNQQALVALSKLNTSWKFVCISPEDVREAVTTFVDPFNLENVYIMPEGQTSEAIVLHGVLLADEVLKYPKLNLTTRLHIALWGDVRGK